MSSPSSISISGVVSEPPQPPTSIQFNNYPSGGIDENLAIGNKICDLTSVDASTNDPGSFSIVSGGSYCQAVGTELQVANILSYEDGATRSCTVRVTDRDALTFDKTLIVVIMNVNEAPTSLSVSTNNMDEEQTDTTITMTPSDPDNVGPLSIGQTFTFNLLIDGDGHFELDSSNPGILLVRRKADYESLTVKTLALQVRVTDSGIAGVGGSRGLPKVLEQADFGIAVNDVNESPHTVRLVPRSAPTESGTRGWVTSSSDTEATIHEWCPRTSNRKRKMLNQQQRLYQRAPHHRHHHLLMNSTWDSKRRIYQRASHHRHQHHRHHNLCQIPKKT